MHAGQQFKEFATAGPAGDIIEFGTFTAASTAFIASWWGPDRGEVFTIDAWQGLPKSTKELPRNGAWNEGAFKGSKEAAAQKLKNFPNVTMIDSWIDQLNSPSTYGIGPVAAVNVDVDIYESTVSSLAFLDTCLWVDDSLVVRFDDWAHPKFKESVAQHEKLAYEEYLQANPTYKSETLFHDHLVAIVRLSR